MRLAIVVALALLACGKSEPKHEDRHDQPTAVTKLALNVVIPKGESTSAVTWTEADFAKVTKMAGAATDGEARDTWSLRELVHTLLGPTTRVVSVKAKDTSVAITQAAWDDPAKTPILHTTKRGALKFRYATPDGKWDETVLKDVTAIVVQQ